MNKAAAKASLLQYLKKHFISYETDLKESTPRYSLCFQGYENSPNHTVESCFWFYDTELEVRTYFTETASALCRENRKYLPDLMRLFNYINARVWLKASDGMGGALYAPHSLYTPRIYMTEDGYYDITLTTLIDYRCFEIAPLETADYITAYCPELLDSLSPAIFGVLLGKYNLEEAIQNIQVNVFG